MPRHGATFTVMRSGPALAGLAALLLPAPALGWDFSPLPLCTLSHVEAGVEITVTHDPAAGEYAITLTLVDGAWPRAGTFHIGFTGGQALTIGTAFHQLSDDARSLTVRDSGFGNVLDGLEFNSAAVAWSGDLRVAFSLDGAAEPVRRFRACPQGLNLS